MRLLVGDDDVEVVAGAQAVVGDAEQAVGVGRQIDAHDVGALVGDDVEEAGVLVGEAVVVLPPDERGDEQVDGGDGRAPAEFVLGFFQPLGVLVEHGVDDVDEGLVGGEEAVAAGEHVAFEPAFEGVLAEHLHDAAVRARSRCRRRRSGRISASQVLSEAS